MGSFALGGMIEQRTSTATSGSTTTMTLTSTTWQRFTGSADETVRLPDATNLKVGKYYRIENASTGTLTIEDGSSTEIATVSPGTQREFNLYSVSGAAGDWEISNQVDIDGPLRLFATRPTEDAKLNIRANQITSGSGQVVSTPPIDDLINSFVDATIDFTSGDTVPPAAVFVDGSDFALPSGTINFYRRMVIVYQSADNILDTTFSDENAAQGSLTNPGTLFAALDGVPVGYIDLQNISGASTWRSASDSGSNILDKDIVIFGSGSSAGAAGDTSFKMQSISSNVGKIKKGFLIVDDGREFVTHDGSNPNVDIDFNLKTAVNSLGVTSPSSSTTYYLYLDLSFAPSSTITVGDVDRVAYAAESGTTGMFVIFITTPENTSAGRYIPITALKTDGSSNYTEFDDLARRRHDSTSFAVSPLVGTPVDQVSIGSIGAVANAQQAIAAGDFSGGTASFFFLDTDDGGTISDDSANSNDLTKNGDPAFTAKGFFGRETIIDFDGTGDFLSSAAAHYNPGDTNFSTGGWFKIAWATTAQTLISQENSGADLAFSLNTTTTNIVFEATNAATPASYAVSASVPHNFTDGDWHHIAAVFDTAANTFVGYIDGQLATTNTLSDVNSVAAAKFNISGEQNGTALMVGSAQDVFFVNGDALTATEINAIYSRRFKAGDTNANTQLAGSHILTDDSFPCTTLTNRGVYYNLAADALDDSGNSFDLTNTGSTPFTGLNIFGTAAAADLDGSTQHFSSANAFFDIDPDIQSFSTGGVFALNNWTPSADQDILSLSDASDAVFIIRIDTTGNVQVVGDTGNVIDFSNPEFIDGSWHHIAISSTAGGNVSLHIDGANVVSAANTDFVPAGTPTFGVGTSRPTFVNKMAGRIQDVFFFKNTAFSDEDMRKIASSRVDLTGTAVSVGCDNQIWEGTFEREDSLIKNNLSDGWLLDRKDDKIYADFGDASGDCVTLKLYDGSLGVTTIPAKCFDKTFTATPATTLVHNLAATPTSISVLHDELATGKFTPLDPESFIKVDGTNITTAGFGLLTIDATHPLRIIACAGATAIGTGASSGGAGWNVITLFTTTYTASVQDDVLVDTTNTVTVTLPASPTAGDKVKVTDGYSNAATNNITIARNGSLIDTVAADFTINVDSVWTEFVFMDSTRGWVTRT